ncbi:hypothetical protein ACA910_008125 [Epithemia clementina (nom. ined.)]
MNHGSSFMTSYLADPMACLQAMVHHPPSLDALPQLAGRVASSIQEGETTMNPAVALLYLKASARHLSVLVAAQPPSQLQSQPQASSSLATSGGGGFVLHSGSVSVGSSSSDPSSREMQQSQHVNEITEALCHAATRCQPRSGIAESGILPVLAGLLPSKSIISNSNSNSSNSLVRLGPVLTPLHADILHISLCAGQAQEAERIVADDWPRPSRGLGVIVVLRYFYLRGMVHLECQNWEWAIRCFWTCLVIPADAAATSAIVVAAWKKLVLVQALTQSDRLPAEDTTTVLKFPKTTPVCVSRFISQAMNHPTGPGGSTTTTTAPGGASPHSARPQHVESAAASVVAPAPEDVAALSSSGSSSSSSSMSLLHLEELALADGTLVSTNTTTGAPNARAAPRNVVADSGVRAYSDLVRAFVKVHREAFGQVLAEKQNQFVVDGNWKLVQRLESELVKRQIYQWSRVVSVIPLARLSEFLSIPTQELPTLLEALAAEQPEQPRWNIQVKDEAAYFPKHVPTVTGGNRYSAELAKLTDMMQRLDASISMSTRFLSLVRRDSAAAADSKATGPRGVEDV